MKKTDYANRHIKKIHEGSAKADSSLHPLFEHDATVSIQDLLARALRGELLKRIEPTYAEVESFDEIGEFHQPAVDLIDLQLGSQKLAKQLQAYQARQNASQPDSASSPSPAEDSQPEETEA